MHQHGKRVQESAINPHYNNLILTIRKRRLRYLSHIFQMDENRLVRRTLVAYVKGGSAVPEDYFSRTAVEGLSKISTAKQ